MWVFQHEYDLFINKKQLCINFLVTGAMALLNLCLYIKYLYLSDEEEGRELMEGIIKTLILFILLMTAFSFVINFVSALETP